jgi:hypothetical protein
MQKVKKISLIFPFLLYICLDVLVRGIRIYTLCRGMLLPKALTMSESWEECISQHLQQLANIMRAKGRSLPTSKAHLISFQFSFQLFGISCLLMISEYIMSSLHLHEALFDSSLFYQCCCCECWYTRICRDMQMKSINGCFFWIWNLPIHGCTSASVGARNNIKVWGGRLCSWPNYMTWFSNDDHPLIIVTKMCVEHVCHHRP